MDPSFGVEPEIGTKSELRQLPTEPVWTEQFEIVISLNIPKSE